MLTSDLIRPRIRMQGMSVSVDFVDEQDPRLQETAHELIALFQCYRGRSQESWQEALEEFEGTRVDYIIIRGLAKVLTDDAEFTPPPTPITPTQIREKLFAYGPVFERPDIGHHATRQHVLREVAQELALPCEQLDDMLFADRHASYHLTHPGGEWTPPSLLARYNLELARGLLYWSAYITVEISDHYKDIWKYIKLFKLMFDAELRPEGGYRLILDGPISPFVSSTLRYGRQLAAFLPALLLCEYWHMQAHVYPPQGRGEMLYTLDHTCTLQSHFKRSGQFDSRLEADFAAAFADKMGERRGHWQLARESELLLLGDTVMIPDFVLTDDRGEQRRVLVELVGFWHPDYLRRKIEKVRAAQCQHLLLLVSDRLNVTEQDFADTPGNVVFFHEKPVLKDVMAAVEEIALRVYGPPPAKVRKSTRKSTES